VDPVLELMWNLIRAYHLNHAAAGITSGSLDSSTPPPLPRLPRLFAAGTHWCGEQHKTQKRRRTRGERCGG
jgi:hypothetical protein